MARLDATWRVGLASGVLIALLTIVGVWLAARGGNTAPLGLGVLGWLVFMGWLEKGVTK